MAKMWARISREHEEYIFHCPACKYAHSFVTKWHPKIIEERNKECLISPVWKFNGNYQEPSFSPSLRYRAEDGLKLCHLYVRNGNIEYLSDCDHAYANQKIPLPDVD